MKPVNNSASLFHRNRTLYAAFILMVICLGLISRSRSLHLPAFYSKYAGDALWAAMVFLIAGWLCPRKSTPAVAALAIAFSCAIEFSQLYHAPFVDRVRHNVLGHLVLGDTFAWADIGAYFVGIVSAATVELLASRKYTHRQVQRNVSAD